MNYPGMFGLKNNAWQWTSASRIFSSPRFLAGTALKILNFCWHQVQIPPSATEDTIQLLPLVPEEERWPVLGEERPLLGLSEKPAWTQLCGYRPGCCPYGKMTCDRVEH